MCKAGNAHGRQSLRCQRSCTAPSQAIPVIRPLLTIPAKRGSLAQVLEGLMSERSSSIGEPMKFVEFALKKLRRLLVPPQDLETGWLGLTRTVVFWILDVVVIRSY